MTARPILLIGKRRFLFQWTTLVAPANDRPRLRRALNDNSDGAAA